MLLAFHIPMNYYSTLVPQIASPSIYRGSLGSTLDQELQSRQLFFAADLSEIYQSTCYHITT